MPSEPQIGGVDVLGVVYLVLVLAVVFLPIVLGRSGPPPGPSDSDSDDGGGNGPGPPHPPSNTPGGGLPLEDSEPARTRLRGHERLADLLPARARRPSREPHRRPARTTDGGANCSTKFSEIRPGQA
jgi:hypothetical protein